MQAGTEYVSVYHYIIFSRIIGVEKRGSITEAQIYHPLNVLSPLRIRLVWFLFPAQVKENKFMMFSSYLNLWNKYKGFGKSIRLLYLGA